MKITRLHLKTTRPSPEERIHIEPFEKIQEKTSINHRFDPAEYLREVKTPHVGLLAFIK